MKSSFNLFLLLLAVIMTLNVGCSSNNGTSKDAAEDDTMAVKILEAPKDGKIVERVRKLWEKTRPMVEADEKAKLSDEEYLKKRNDIFGAWVDLQVDNSISDEKSEDVSKLIPRILELIDHVYGFPGSTKEDRMEERKNTGRTAYLIKELDKKVSDLPK